MTPNHMDKLSLDFVHVTDKAAIAAAMWIGRGERKTADKAATEAMRSSFNSIDFNGKVVIGEGVRDKAPMLFIGEKVGTGSGMEIDLAVDPLECTNAVALGRRDAISVIAAAPQGCLLHAPDIYMDKIAVGPKAKGVIDLDSSVKQNITNVAEALDKPVEETRVIILERDRHSDLVQSIRDTGARIYSIPDGDIMGAIVPSLENSTVDILLGIGAAPEGVIAAAAVKALGGEMQGRLHFMNDEMKQSALDLGVSDLEKKYGAGDLVKGDAYSFIATGVCTGPLLKGVEHGRSGVKTHSLVIKGETGSVKYTSTYHPKKEE